jgi:phosphoribosylamine---glycine ligase
MKILVVGGGGREHALCWKLSQSQGITDLFCAPGNAGIAAFATCVGLDGGDVQGVVRWARLEHIDLIIVGPEGPLALGLVDACEREGLAVFGPHQYAAQIETSKIFAKKIMEQAHVPTAEYRRFTDYAEAHAYVNELHPPYVIKADGLCAGKGAYVIRTADEGEQALKEILVDRIFGVAGKELIVERFLNGIEASYLAFTDGKSILPMLPSQDHKPLLDDDEGPNTGGMGAYTPVPFVDETMDARINGSIMRPTIEALAAAGARYSGVLYGGILFEDGAPYVLEFNARFGDPETQPVLFKMESDILPIITACVEGRLSEIEAIRWRKGVAVCVVIASRGYPEKPEKGKLIHGLEDLRGREDVMVFHAGTKAGTDGVYTSGGRVLGVTALGETYADAIEKAYEAVSCIDFEGMYFRRDIGRKALLFSTLNTVSKE